jgi:hypothetical protein
MNYQIGHRIQQQTRNGRFGYRLESVEPYTTIRGVPSAILTWRGTCAVCGAAFSVTSGRKPARWLQRTCEQHRRKFYKFRCTTKRIEEAAEGQSVTPA